jgi:hypothetical protein
VLADGNSISGVVQAVILTLPGFPYTMNLPLTGNFLRNGEEKNNKPLRNIADNGKQTSLQRGAHECALLFRPEGIEKYAAGSDPGT